MEFPSSGPWRTLCLGLLSLAWVGIPSPGHGDEAWVQTTDADFAAGTGRGVTITGAGQEASLTLAPAPFAWKRTVTVTNPSAEALNAFPVRVALNAGNFDFSRTRPDGADIRFVDTDETTLLAFWTESWDRVAQTAVVWVKLPSLAAGEARAITLYYGSAEAAASSDGAATFLWFDDFEDLSAWSQSGSTVSVANGVVTLDSGTNPLISTGVAASPPYVVEARYRHPSSFRNRLYLTRVGEGSPTGYDYGVFDGRPWWNGSAGPVLALNSWYVLRWENTLSNYTWRVLDADWTELFARSHGSAIAGLNTLVFVGTARDTSDFSLDWVRIRPYAAVEPTFAVGAEGDAAGQVLLPGFGAFESPAFDSGQFAAFSLAWEAETPAGTAVRFQVRTAGTEAGLASAAWHGPTGPDDWYTGSGTGIDTGGIPTRWLQWRAELRTTSPNVSPGLQSVAVTYAPAELVISSNTTWPEGDHLVGDLTVNNGATLTLAGGSSLTATGTLTITGNSKVLCQGKNTAGQVDGQWAGQGVTITAGDLTVEAGSRITADGQGYATGPGFSFDAGGSHGGRGNGVSPAPTYGSVTAPTDLGSGGRSGYNTAWSYGGGAIRLEVAGSLTLHGEVTADGVSAGNGASGGSLYVTTGGLVGGGVFTANGTVGNSWRAIGGGGRIAVYYQSAGGFSGFAASTASCPDPSKAEDGTVLFCDLSVPNGHVQVWQDLAFGEDSAPHYGALTVENGGRLVLGGGSTLSVDGALTVTGNSMVLCQGKNTAGRVDGRWAGEGVTVSAADLIVEAGSAISADGQGYSTGPGYAYNLGASHGGRGGGAGSAATYGSAATPVDLGSGGTNFYNTPWSYGGGAIRLNVAQVLTVDGAVTASGVRGGAGASGGSIHVAVGALAGAGRLSADGSPGNWGSSGGGGRVAVYHWGSLDLPTDHITAAAGGGEAQAGSVVVSNAPLFLWSEPTGALFHGTELLVWDGLAVDWLTVTVDVTAYGPLTASLGEGLPCLGQTEWDTTLVPDGAYELRATFRDGAGAVVGEAVRSVLVSNAYGWHGGTVAADETWAAGTVHVIETYLTLAAGVRVTVEPGAVVKVARDVQITVEDGAVLDAQGIEAAPIVFTSLLDDSVAGDTNFDGDDSLPRPGDWAGIALTGAGQFATSGHTDLRYLTTTHSGVLTTDQIWVGSLLHHVTGDVVVPAGVTLSINPGATVKLDLGRGLTVQPGGVLMAPGTTAQPVVFTSIRDDSVGGDTNGDGDTTAPAPGDWKRLHIDGGRAEFDHCDIRYGAGPDNVQDALIRTSGNAELTVINSRLADGFYTGVLCWGGTAVLTSTLITGLDRGVSAHPGGTLQLTNCTLDDNRVGALVHGGVLSLTNSIVSHSTQHGLDWDLGGTGPAVRYCDVWGSGTQNYHTVADQTGLNGNISADPQYRDRARGDFRLDYLSPCVDAADSTAAPASDHMGAPRYDDPRTPNTGIPDAGGAYADMGAFEFVETAASDVDLVVTQVIGPTEATAGETVTVRWTVRNNGSSTAVGPWHDAVALVRDPDTNPVAVSAGEALVGTGVGLGPGESVTLEGDVRVPGSTLGFHRWQVTANRRGEVFEGSNTANNTTVSSAQVALSLPVLALGHGGLTGQFTAAGEEHWFAVTPGAGQDVLLSLDLLGDGGTTELYIGCGYMPSREHFDVRQTEWHAADTTAVLAGTNGQTYYVLAYAASLGAPDAAFALQAQAIEFSLSAVSPTACGRGRVTFKLQGGKLAEDMQYDLVGPGRTAYPAVAVFPVNSATIHPTFDLTGAALGTYTVQVTSQGVTHALPGAIGVEDTGPGWVAFDIVAPSATRPDWTFPVVVNYANRGSTDVVAPLFRVDIENANALVPSPSDSRQRLFERLFTSKYMLGIPAEGPAGVLPPGASGAVTLEATCTGSPTRVGYVIASYGGPEFPIDLESLRADMQPGWVPDDAWQAAFASFVAAVGPSSAAYQQAMADDATHLSRFGVRTHDVARLSAFELRWDGLYGVVQRYHLGAFGRGPSHPWDIRVCREERRGWQLVRYGSGLVRPFLPSGGASPDVYAGAPGDPGTLSLSADGAEAVLTEHDGTRLRFFAGPSDPAESQSYRLGSVEEMNGKRTTLTYLDGRVTDVTLGSGDTLTFTYNSAGRVTAMTDWVGRVTSFAYDPAGEHVAAVTDARGTTQFEHVTGRGAAREHALAAITYRDGTHTFFEYDDFGRLARQWRDGGAEEVRMRYDAVGTQSVINALGGTAVLLVGEFGYVGAYRDPLGRETTLNRDLSGKLLSAATRNGPSAAFSYDATGNVLSVLDPLGARLQFAYGPCAHLSGFTDARGASTAYARDARSNLAGITYPDGARCQFTYDDRGNPVRWVNARGEATSYTYDSHRLLVRKERDDGYWVEYAYDGHRNLLAATDPNGTTAFEYDAADRVTQVSYPNGKSLAYAYDAGGRRSRMTDGIGYTVDYTYDAVGRLRQLSDGAGSPMVTYSYDAVGRVVRSDLGNGTCTTYDFDAVGNVLQQATHATDGAALSRFDCSYDTLGRLTGTTTLDGTWAYSYDAAGQLTGVVLPSGEAVRYTYDAMGNRTAVEDNGSMTHYSTNALNQYTAVGGAQYQYDADGNLVRKVDGADSWHYAYDGEGHLVTAVTPSGTWVYTYDALGQRIAGTRDGQATEYVIDPFGLGDVVAEYSGDGALVANYVHGLGLVSRLDPAGGAAYYAFDPAANTVALTDAADAVVNRYTYLPFGEIVSSSEALANPFTFVGLYGVMADAAGLCYMRNRWYDPCTGRFVQRDPLGISGGDVNLAVYARNRPIAVVDPLGLSAIPTGMTSRRSDASFAPMTTGYSPQPTEAAEVTGLGLGYVHAGSWQMDPAVLDSATASPGSLGSNYDDFDANAWGGPQWGNSSDFLFLFTPAGTPHTNWLPNFDSEFHIVTVDGVALNDVYDLCSELPTAKGASARMAPPELVEYCLLLGSGDSDVLTSGDPNDIVGPGGVGESHWLTTQMLPYMVRFENDPELANAAAQQVVVTLPLDTTLDWSTFELTGFGFGSNAYHLTGGLQAHTERLALREELGLCVDVDFALDPATGLVTWRFTSIDPVTGQPTRDPLAGFLPPNITSPEGQGYVTYTVRPLASLVTGDTISAKASIIFDTNRRHRHEHACQHHRCGSPGGCGDRTAGRGTLSGLPGELVGRG